MKKALSVLLVIFFAGILISSKDLRKKAEENPLDCAYYLASTDSFYDNYQLAEILFEFGRLDDALRAVHFENGEHVRIPWLVVSSAKLIKQGNFAKANQFLDKTIENIKNEGEYEQAIVLILLAKSLIELGRTADAFSTIEFAQIKFNDEEDKIAVAVGVSKAFLDKGENENSIKALSNVFERAEPDQKAEIIELYFRLNQKQKAENLLSSFEKIALSKETNASLYGKLLPLIKANISVGKAERALELWRQFGDEHDSYEYFQMVNSLIKFGEREKANLYLSRAKLNPEMLKRSRKYVVEHYLKLSDIELALDAAKSHSIENDDFWQQKSLMEIADKLIEDNRIQAALEILEYAFQKADKVENISHPSASIGADPASRKIIYLRDIFNRYVKLKRLDNAQTVIDSFEYKAEKAKSLIELAKLQIKTLPRKAIQELLLKAQNAVKDEGNYNSISVKLLCAEVYAQMGEKEKTVRLITEALAEAKESCCYEEAFLLSAGKIFEQNKLRADTNLKRVLKEIIADKED